MTCIVMVHVPSPSLPGVSLGKSVVTPVSATSKSTPEGINTRTRYKLGSTGMQRTKCSFIARGAGTSIGTIKVLFVTSPWLKAPPKPLLKGDPKGVATPSQLGMAEPPKAPL